MQHYIMWAVIAIWIGMMMPSARAENPLLRHHVAVVADDKIAPVQAPIQKHQEPIQKFAVQAPIQKSAVQKSVIQKANRRLTFFERRRSARAARAQARALGGCASGLCS